MITKSFPVGVASECIDEAMEYEAQSYLIETWDEGQHSRQAWYLFRTQSLSDIL